MSQLSKSEEKRSIAKIREKARISDEGYAEDSPAAEEKSVEDVSKEDHSRIPQPLRERAIVFALSGTTFIILSGICVSTLNSSKWLFVSGLLIGGLLIAYSIYQFVLFYRKGYAIIRGTVIDATVRGWRRQNWEVVFQAGKEQDFATFAFDVARKGRYRLLPGDKVKVYLPINYDTREKNGVNVILTFYAYERYGAPAKKKK